MTIYIGLLRGINVGGNNQMKMAELRQVLAERGFKISRTMLQSGNAVFAHAETAREELESRLEEATRERFGICPDWMVRTSTEWEAAIAANPFQQEAKLDPSHLLTVFLKEDPDLQAVESVRAALKGPERLAFGAGNLYIFFPGGIGKSKIDRTPGYGNLIKRGTARNWNTVLKLAEVVQELRQLALD